MASNNYYSSGLGGGGISGGFQDQTSGPISPHYGVAAEGFGAVSGFQGVHSPAMRSTRGGIYPADSQPISTFGHFVTASRPQGLMAGYDDKAYYMSLGGGVASTAAASYETSAPPSHTISSTGGGMPFYSDSRNQFGNKGATTGGRYGGFGQALTSGGQTVPSSERMAGHGGGDMMLSGGGVGASISVSGPPRTYGSGPQPGGTTDWQRRQQFNQQQRFRPHPQQQLAARPQQLHYCDVCKISCAGAQTYTEHLEGKNHKKKELLLKNAPQTGGDARAHSNNNTSNSNTRVFYCELCDVACTGCDTYAAHLRGTKHQKVISLHTKLGKPIPEITPPPTSALSMLEINGQKSKNGIKNIGGSAADQDGNGDGKSGDGEDDSNAPIGLEYIEEAKVQNGTSQGYYCKLCDCSFTDPVARIMHSKGRRHRLQYKNKVDPTITVDMKSGSQPRSKQQKGYYGGGDARYRVYREDYRRQVEELRYEKELLQWQLANSTDRYDMSHMQMVLGGIMDAQPEPLSASSGFNYAGAGHVMDLATQQSLKEAESIDDRHVLAKHASIYPTEDDLAAVQTTVSACERALKLISDKLAEENKTCESKKDKTVDKDKQTNGVNGKEESVKEKSESSEAAKREDKEEPPERVLKGVMRIGLLAKGLLLHNDLNMELVVMCQNSPTNALLRRILDALPDQLAAISTDKYLVRLAPNGNSITVMRDVEPRTTSVIVLTSHAVKEQASVLEERKEDLLDTGTSLTYLARLRHTKWFQAKASLLPSCLVIIRVLRDFSERVPSWKHLPQWALELLIEKALSSGRIEHPGEALRRVFECVASGILLPGGSGLHDPCERESVDAAACLTEQQREDITNCAQHALRMIAFGQIHRVLDMERLAQPASSAKHGRSKAAEQSPEGEETSKETETAAADSTNSQHSSKKTVASK